MPYTATQLTQYYTSINGTAPDQATALQFTAIAQQNANGTLSDAATLRFALNSAQTLATTDVALATYQFFTGQAPSVAGIAYLVSNPGTGFNTAYYNGTGTVNGGAASATNVAANGFDLENRYYNQSVALALDTTAGATFRSNYGGLTLAQTIQVAYETIIGQSNVTPANYAGAIANITAAIPYFQSVALRQAGTVDGAGTTAGQNIALKAVIVGYILEEGLKADVGTYANAIDQFNATTAAGNNPDPASGATGVNLLATFAPGGTAYGTGIGATSSNSGGVNGSGSAGTALTPNIETVSGSTFNGGLFFNAQAGNYVQTLNSGDVLNGTAGGANNTLNVTFNEAAAQVVVPTLNNISTVNVVELGTAGTNLLLNNSSAVKNINVQSATSAVTVSNNAGALTSLTVGNTGANAVTVTSTGPAVAGTADTIALNVGANTGVNTSNAAGTAGTQVSLAGYEIVNLNSTGANNAANTINTLNITDGSLTTLNVTGTGAVTLLGLNGATLTTINAGGTAAVAATSTTAAVPAVAALPGPLVIGAASSGDGFTASTNAIALVTPTAPQLLGASVLNYTGTAGNDTLYLTGLAASDTLNGGAGTDTLGILAADNPTAALNVTNFEQVQFLTTAPTLTAGTALMAATQTNLFTVSTTVNRALFGASVDTVLLGSGANFSSSVAAGSTVTVSNLNSGNNVTFDYNPDLVTANGTAAAPTAATSAVNATQGSLTTTLAADGSADVLNLTLRDTDPFSATGLGTAIPVLTATGFETVNLNLTGGAGTVATVGANTANLAYQNNDTLTITSIVDTALTTLTVKGATNLTIADQGTTALNALATIDASAATGNITLGAAGAAPTNTTLPGANVPFTVATTGAAVSTGSGNDFVALSLGTTANLKAIAMGAETLGTSAGTATPLSISAAGVVTTSTLTVGNTGDTLALTAVAGQAGLSVIDLSSTTDQISSLLGSVNTAAQTGIENIDLSGITVAGSGAQIVGSAGSNFITGTALGDTINAGAGNDVIRGGLGVDVVSGGSGIDQFNFYATTAGAGVGDAGGFTAAQGTAAGLSNANLVNGNTVVADAITDWAASETIVLNSTQTLTQVAAGTTVANGNYQTLAGTYDATTNTFTVNSAATAATANYATALVYDGDGTGAFNEQVIVLVGTTTSQVAFQQTAIVTGGTAVDVFYHT